MEDLKNDPPETVEPVKENKFLDFLKRIEFPSTHTLLVLMFGCGVLGCGLNDFSNTKQFVCFVLSLTISVAAGISLKTVHRKNKQPYQLTQLD